MNYTISDIAKILGEKSVSRSEIDFPIKQLLTDSRSKFSGNPEHILFFAIKGERNDGHKFIGELFKRGVRNFVVSENIFGEQTLKEFPSQKNEAGLNVNFICVENTISALQKLCAHHRKQFQIPVIGITGSNGKTIVKEWLYQLLSPDKNIVRSPKSYNSQVGVPISVWQMNEQHQLGIFEAGISQIGEMQNLEKIIQPTLGIVTNIGSAHDVNFENRKQKAEEKIKLFQNAETVFYCSDYDEIESELGSFRSVKKVSWSKNKNADFKITSIKKLQNRTQIEGIYSPSPLGKVGMVLPFTDEASIENAIHCWLAMLHLGYENSEINRRIRLLNPVAMRLEQKEGINNCTIINDSYNSDTGSLAIALDFLNQQNQHAKKTLILSDILQSGKDDEKLYSEVAELVNNKGVNRIIGIGKSISLQFTKFENEEKKFFYNTEAFLNEFLNFHFENEAILLKGSRPFEFEKINALLQKKSHETVLEIHLNSLVNNLNFFRSKLKTETKIMAMVKAFSYGSGSFEIANILQFHRVDYLAVAYADEGVELRNAGITLPIMVMNPEGFDSLLKYQLEPEIYNFRLLEQLSIFLKNKNQKIPIHIKIDTGMHRLGFETDKVDSLIFALKNEKNILVKSVFSHLSASDEKEHDDFTLHQITQFTEAAEKISKEFSTKENRVLKHILNSSGILRFPEVQMDMVRLGIGLYGVGNELQNVVELKTIISQIKKIKQGASIGYNRNAIAGEEIVTATVPIGYADGFSRRLGNGRGKMLVNGKFANTIGNVCMDMCMLDITGIDAKEGDEAIVFGNEYTVEEIAKDAETIPYEILTGISRRVKRVYFQE